MYTSDIQEFMKLLEEVTVGPHSGMAANCIPSPNTAGVHDTHTTEARDLGRGHVIHQ